MFIRFEYVNGKIRIVPMQSEKDIREYLERFKNIGGGIDNYKEVNIKEAIDFEMQVAYNCRKEE